jgi:hypothetical protein
MAAYGRGDYSGGRYSYGAYLGALAIVSASTVVVAGQKIKDAQFEISSSSTVAVGAVKIASTGAVIVDTSVITIAGGIDAVGNVNIVATSILDVQYNRIQHFSAVIIDSSSVVINARKKWENEADTSETWTPIEDVSESWTTVSV